MRVYPNLKLKNQEPILQFRATDKRLHLIEMWWRGNTFKGIAVSSSSLALDNTMRKHVSKERHLVQVKTLEMDISLAMEKDLLLQEK